MSQWEQQMAHEQTGNYYRALKAVILDSCRQLSMSGVAVLNNFSVLEIGTDWGISAKVFLDFGCDVVSVDKNPLRKEAQEYITSSKFHQVLRGSDEYFSEQKLWGKFDIVYIDGDHTYEQVIKDLENGFKACKSGGLVILHDVLHKGNYEKGDYGVYRALAMAARQDWIKNIIKINPVYPGLAYFTKQ